MLFVVCFFFCQAEDGIRDAQESRGLGDVYKRQVYTYEDGERFICPECAHEWPMIAAAAEPVVARVVRDANGPVAAISVPVPTQRFAGNEERYAAAVGATAARASALLTA